MSDGNVRDFNKEKVKREEHQEYPRIAKLNDDFAVITLGGGVAILRENMGEDGSDFVLWNKSDLKLWLENQPAVEWEQDGRKKLQTLADYWLSHPARRQYEHGIIFSPGKTLPASFYNVWKGF